MGDWDGPVFLMLTKRETELLVQVDLMGWESLSGDDQVRWARVVVSARLALDADAEIS